MKRSSGSRFISDCSRLAMLALAMGWVLANWTNAGNQAETSAAKPASLAQVRAAIDWLTFPKPPKAQWEETDLLKCEYWILGTLDEAAGFFRKTFPEHGWTEEKPANPDADPDNYRSLEFTKAGFLVSLFLEGKKQSVKIHLSNRGNVDARRLPTPNDVKVLAATRSGIFFETPSKPEEVAAFCRKELAALGWRETPERNTQSEDNVSLRFVQNAMECQVVMYKDPGTKKWNAGYHTAVRSEFEPAEVAANFTAKEIPKPATIQETIAMLDLRKLPRLGELPFKVNDGVRAEYEARASVAKAVAFYRKTLAELGWTLSPHLIDSNDRGSVWFEKAGFLLGLEIEDLIEVVNKAGMVRIVLSHHGNVDPRQLPYPPGAEISYVRHLNRQFTTSASPAEAATFYERELGRLGWKKVKFVHPAFVQNDTRLTAYIHNTRAGRTPIQLSIQFPGKR